MSLCVFFLRSLRGSFRCLRRFPPFGWGFRFYRLWFKCGYRRVVSILGQSLAWFEGETRRMAEVRSSELETGLSSSGGPEGGDTIVSAPRVVRAFHALEEVCGLDEETMSRFKDRFQFPERVHVRRPTSEDRACHFFPGEVCFYEAAFTCGLRLPVHPFIMELLGFLGIAPGQLMPNS